MVYGVVRMILRLSYGIVNVGILFDLRYSQPEGLEDHGYGTETQKNAKKRIEDACRNRHTQDVVHNREMFLPTLSRGCSPMILAPCCGCGFPLPVGRMVDYPYHCAPI